MYVKILVRESSKLQENVTKMSNLKFYCKLGLELWNTGRYKTWTNVELEHS